MAEKSDSKSPKKRGVKERRRKTVAGFSRFLYAMNLMLEAASSQSKLTHHETLLLSIFRNGIISRKRVDEEFRRLLVVQPDNTLAAQALTAAFDGLVNKGLIKPVKRSVRITKEGRSELLRISNIVDSVYDQLIYALASRERDEVQALMRKLGSA